MARRRRRLRRALLTLGACVVALAVVLIAVPMVAVLARGSALGVLAGAALMAVILNSGIILQTQGLNTSTVLAITGLILFFTAIGDELAHYRIVPVESKK